MPDPPSTVAKVSAPVLLVTCSALPDGEPGGQLLLDALTERDLTARWVSWDDPQVDWGAAALIAVRSAWDYDQRLDEFLAWSDRVGAEVGDRMLNGPAVFGWNVDKRYLAELHAAGLPVVPTIVAEDEGELPPAIAAYEHAVVKSTVGAGGRGVVVFDGVPGGPEELDESALLAGPWVVQPLVESIRTVGEHSVFVLGGQAQGQVRKVPASGEIRVHEAYGGSSVPLDLDHEAAARASTVVSHVERTHGWTLDYARVDLLHFEGRWVVSELELVEPGLYLDIRPELADAFADVVAARLALS